MAHTETTLNSQTIFSGRIIEVKKDDIQLENGKKSIREVVVHHGGVCVAAIDQEDRLLLVRQFRYPYGKELLELPAGKIELGEDPRECGIRELQEECGCTADRFEKLAQLYPTPAYCTEVIHIYRASGLHESVQKLDDGEFLDVLRIPFAQAVQMVMDGEISDAKTQIGILKLHLLRQAEASNKHSTLKSSTPVCNARCRAFFIFHALLTFLRNETADRLSGAATIAAVIPPALALKPPVSAPNHPFCATASRTPLARVAPNPVSGTVAPAPANSISG